ncbi:MAG: SDR family NAD(P)-dependent oxidoreductase, partial [Spirochaetales bacterium]
MKRTAVITGASRGIGLAIANQLGLDGMNVVMVATGPAENNMDAIVQLQKNGITVGYIQADISKHDDRIKIVRHAVRLFGRIDV